MHFKQIEHYLIPYSLPPVTTPGSQTSLLPAQLAGYHIQPLGFTSGSGLLAGVDIRTVPEGYTLSTDLPSSGRGGTEAVGQRCHKEGGALPRTVYQQALSDSQEGRILLTCGESEASELVHYQGSLQDGRDQHAEGSVAGKRLDGIHRFEGCVPLSGSESRTQEVPPLCLGRTDIRISVPSIRVEQCTKGVHKTPEACGGSPQAARNPPGDFLRRHASSCPVKGGSGGTDEPNSPAVQSVGVFSQSREVTVDPSSADSFSGVYNRLSELEDPTYTGEDGTTDRDVQNYQAAGKPDSARSHQDYRENDGHLPSNPPSPFKVPELAETEVPSSAKVTVLRDHSQPGCGCQEGVKLVDNFNGFSQWEEYFDSGTRFDDGIRCLPVGVGGSVRGSTHRWSLVTSGEVGAHKLPGADSGYVCSEGLLQGQRWVSHSTEARKQDCNDICKSHGGTRSPQLNDVATQLWTWCLESGITLSAEHLPGVDNCIADLESRSTHSSAEWQLRKDVFADLMQEVYQCNVDLFASRLNHQLPHFVSWRPDPYAMGTDALKIPWTRWRGYAFPPFVLISKVLKKIREEGSTILLIAPVWESSHGIQLCWLCWWTIQPCYRSTTTC